MKSILTLTVAFLLTIGAQAQKEQALPKDLPPYGRQEPLPSQDVKAVKLENGLTVWLVAQPGLPKVSFGVVVLGGLAADPVSRPGLSELLSNTLSEGTKTRSARQIAEGFQAAGGDLSVSANRDRIIVSTNVLSSKTEATLGLLADVLTNASFPDNEIALAKRNLSDSLRQNEGDPGFQASRALAKILFAGSTYSVVAPTQDSINQMTAAEVRTEFARRFRPDQALLVAVGDFDTPKMTALLKEKFAGWKAPATAPTAASPVLTTKPPHGIYFVSRPDSVQTTLVFAGYGPRRSDPDYEAAEVANAIYGGTFSSRLTKNIREDKGYTYSPFSAVQTLRQAGVVRTQADVRNAVTGASFNEITYELNRLATTSPTEEELNKAKRYLLGTIAISLQSRSSVTFGLASLWLNGLPPDAITATGKKIDAMSTTDVDAAARKYFPGSRMTIVAVGEEKVIRDALATFGLPLEPAK